MRGKGKIKRRAAGFTLAETLLAVLILLLVSSIVAMGIPVAKQAFEKVTLAGNAELLLSTAVSTLRDELGTAWDVQAGEAPDGGVIYYSADTGNRSRLYIGVSDDKTNATAIRLHEYSKTTKAEALLDIKKNAQKDRELVYQANDGKALQLICESVALDPVKKNTVKITGLCVKDHDGKVTLAQWGGTELEITVFSTKTEEPANSETGLTVEEP